MSIYKQLNDLNITLPELTPPVAAFVPYLRTGNLIFLSGHIAKIDGKPWVGQLGVDVTTGQGRTGCSCLSHRFVRHTGCGCRRS